MSEILRRAAPYVGAPYRLHGETPDGWDCLGCVKRLRAELFGRATPWGPGLYTRGDAVDPDRAEALIFARLGQWREVGPQPGAVILFERAGRCDHVGLLLDPHNFIHADVAAGTVFERLPGKWARRVRGFYETAH